MIRIAFAGVWVHDQDEALAFYTEKLGWELRADVTLPELGNYRWLTVGPPEQPDISVLLNAIPGPPVLDEATAEQIRSLMAKGWAGNVLLTTDDAQPAYEELSRPRDRVHRDPRGAAVRDRRGVPGPFRQPVPPHAGAGGRRRLGTAARVPLPHDPTLVLVAEHADGRRVEGEEAARVRFEPEPAGREDAQQVAVREHEQVAGRLLRFGDDPVGAGRDLLDRLAAGDRAVPDRPVRVLSPDLAGGDSLVFAVVPLTEVVAHLSSRAVAGEAARLAGAP